MFTTLRAQAIAARDTLTSIEHPTDAVAVLGMTPEALTASRLARTRHLPAIREALEVIGTTDAADALPAPGRMAKAGAAQRIGNAVRFLADLGL